MRNRLRAAGRALLAVLLTALTTAPAPAQMTSADGVHYARERRFRIPFEIDPGDRRVQRVLLHVSDDQGKNWRQIAEATPADRGFDFQCRDDGWFYFAVQTVDQDRRQYPATIDRSTPGLKVYVDTTVPVVTVRAFPARDGTMTLEWDIRDDLPDYATMKLEYRVRGGDWVQRGLQRVASGQLTFAPGPGDVEVRLQVKDKAGNQGEATARTGEGGGGGGGGGLSGGGAEAVSNVRKVNTTKISVNYRVEDVGPSDVSVIDVWLTTDTRHWQKTAQPASRQPPHVLEVPGEGRYGVSLVAKSGVGLGERTPQSGDQPQLWIEVDLTPPVVKLLDAVVGRGEDTGKLTVTWQASDKNLSRQPITISYSTKVEGPWQPVPGATSIDNGGRFVWRMLDNVPYEFYLRVEAADEAGNVGKADTGQTVKVDLATPRARVIGIDPVRQP